jgi:hypothetical protein
MNNKFTKQINVLPELEASKACSSFYISFTDRFSRVVRVVGSKRQVFFEFSIDKMRFPVRILRPDNNNNKDNHKRQMHPIDNTMIGNQDMIANLPSTLQANNNESILSTTAEDDDVVTVQTCNSNSTKQAWNSYNIKLLLQNKHNTSATALQHAMLAILETMDQDLGTDAKIFDGNKQQLTDFQFQSITTFRSKFPVSRS